MSDTTAVTNNGDGYLEDLRQPERRLRVVAIEVHLQVADDDGTFLHPVPVQPIPVSPAQWADFNLDHVLEQIRQQMRKS